MAFSTEKKRSQSDFKHCNKAPPAQQQLCRTLVPLGGFQLWMDIKCLNNLLDATTKAFFCFCRRHYKYVCNIWIVLIVHFFKNFICKNVKVSQQSVCVGVFDASSRKKQPHPGHHMLVQSLCWMLTVQTGGPVMCWQMDDSRHTQNPKIAHTSPKLRCQDSGIPRRPFGRKKRLMSIFWQHDNSHEHNRGRKFGKIGDNVQPNFKESWGIRPLYFRVNQWSALKFFC